MSQLSKEELNFILINAKGGSIHPNLIVKSERELSAAKSMSPLRSNLERYMQKTTFEPIFKLKTLKTLNSEDSFSKS